MIRGERLEMNDAEREVFIGFYKILINRMFSKIKISLLHSILGLQLLHLLALLLRKRLFIERKTNYFLVDAEGNR